MDTLKQNHVRYGLIMSAVTAVCLLVMEIAGQTDSFDPKSPVQVVYMYLAPFLVWYFGIRAKRTMLGGQLTFKEGLKEGFKISLVYAIVSPFVFLAYYTLLDSGLLEYARTAYQLGDASDAMVIAVDMVVQFFAAIIFGTIYGAIVSLLLKTKSPPQVNSGAI